MGGEATPRPSVFRAVTLRITLAATRNVTVRIHDVAGREVARVVHRRQAGENEVLWDGTLRSGVKAPAGVYFYRVDGIAPGGNASPSKLVLIGRR